MPMVSYCQVGIGWCGVEAKVLEERQVMNELVLSLSSAV